MCKWVLNMSPKIKMAATDQLHIFCGRKNLMSEIIQILRSHSPQYEDVEVIIARLY